ncbi:MAG: octaprenyl-diphosphate synthase [Rhodothermales bacterium]|jgi:octaprenyl-diphosphate synthase
MEYCLTQKQTNLDKSIESPYPLQAVLDLCAPDMAKVDEFIHESLHSEVVLINQVANYIVSGGGKRLRPMLMILSARACGYQGDRHIPLAAIIEFIHTATLLHDDVVDESEVRRGKQTAHAVWGNAASVLVGDFLYSRSFQMMVAIDSMRVMQIMADATNTIAEGEVLQLLNLGDPEISEASYFKVIENKTAKLFEAACRLGAILAESDQLTEAGLSKFGNKLGLAFQITDDVLDYTGDFNSLGKNVGDDLAEGKPTLPLIYARAASDATGKSLIDRAIRDGGSACLEDVLNVIRTTGALDSAMSSAQSQAEAALQSIDLLPPSKWQAALQDLANYSYRRTN